MLVLLVLLAACAGDDGDTPLEDVPFSSGDLQGPGSDLGAGFTVAPGSHLIGRTFPDLRGRSSDQAGDDRGWRAVLLVSGHPEAVMEAYREQARALGMPVASGRCQLTQDVLLCTAYGESGAESDAQTLQAHLIRYAGREGRQPSSHLWMEYTASGDPPEAAPGPAGAAPPPAERVPFPEDWPELAAPGRTFAAGFGRPPGGLVLEAGSRLVAPPGGWAACGGYVAVVRIDGDPERVLEAYERQFEAAFGRAMSREFGRGVVRIAADEGAIVADAVVRTDGPSYMLIEQCDA